MNTFQKFYQDNKERLFGYLLRRTGSSYLAADIMQESFTRYLERYKDREQSPALLFTISRNLLYDQSRKNRYDYSYQDQEHGTDRDAEKICSVREESRLVLDAFEQLGDEEREILSLVVSSGLSYREIAAVTGNSEANIKVKVHRARKKLRVILAENAT